MERQTWRGGRGAREFGQRAAPEAEGARLRAGGAPVGAGRASAELRELLWRRERAQRERAQLGPAHLSGGVQVRVEADGPARGGGDVHLRGRVGVVLREPHVEVEQTKAVRRAGRTDDHRSPARSQSRARGVTGAETGEGDGVGAGVGTGRGPQHEAFWGADAGAGDGAESVPGFGTRQWWMSVSSGWAKMVGTVWFCTSRSSRMSREADEDMAAARGQ